MCLIVYQTGLVFLVSSHSCLLNNYNSLLTVSTEAYNYICLTNWHQRDARWYVLWGTSTLWDKLGSLISLKRSWYFIQLVTLIIEKRLSSRPLQTHHYLVLISIDLFLFFNITYLLHLEICWVISSRTPTSIIMTLIWMIDLDART